VNPSGTLLVTFSLYTQQEGGSPIWTRGLGSFIAMPLVGAIMSRVRPRYLLVSGILLGSFAMFKLSHLNMDVGSWNSFSALILQGFGMGPIFIPLSTVPNDPIPNERMGERYEHLQPDAQYWRQHRHFDGRNHPDSPLRKST